MPKGTIEVDRAMKIRKCVGDELQSRVKRGKMVGKALLKNQQEFEKAVKSVNKRIMKEPASLGAKPKFQTLVTPQKKIFESLVTDIDQQIDTSIVRAPASHAKTI